MTSLVGTLHSHVRSLRERAGLRPGELARQVGITRQALHNIETGAYAPNTLLAFQLARILGCAVDELFTLLAPQVTAHLIGRVTGETRVQLAQVGGRQLAFPLTGTPGFRQAADGVVQLAPDQGEAGGREVRVELFSSPGRARRTAVLVGCDPALELLSSHVAGHAVAGHAPGVRVLWQAASSRAALAALARGEAHAAGIHLWDARTGQSNRPFVARALPGEITHLFTLWTWEQGLMLPPGNPGRLTGPADLLRPGLRLVNREAGAGSRLLLDAWLDAQGLTATQRQALSGYQDEVPGPLEAAGRVAGGQADVAPGPRSAAQALGLHFIPVQVERFDLVVPEAHLSHPAIAALLEVTRTPAFRSELGALGGYDPAHAGERWQTAVSPPRPQEVAP